MNPTSHPHADSLFKTTSHGLPFYCTDDGGVGRVVKKNEYELPEVYNLSLALGPGKVLVDAGANVGYFTLLGAKLGSRVYAFEPDPRNLEVLRLNVAENRLENVSVYDCALGDRRGDRFLYLSAGNAGDHRTWDDGAEARPSVPVGVRALDDVLGGLERADVLKVDVQGDEVRVLRGAEGLVGRSPGLFLSLEWWPYGLAHNGGSVYELADWLYGHNFFVQAMTGVGQLAVVTKEQLLRLFPEDADRVVNLWCVKGR